MKVLEAGKSAFVRFKDYGGRSSREEFWKFVLFAFLGSILAVIVNSIFFGPEQIGSLKLSIDGDGNQSLKPMLQTNYNGGWIGDAFSLIILVLFVALAIRRMHDIGKSGWWNLMPLPFNIFAFALVYFSTTTVAVDTSMLPKEFTHIDSFSVPGNTSVFLFAWATGFFSSLALIFMFWAKKGGSSESEYGPNPHEVST